MLQFDLSGLTGEPYIGLQFQLLSFPGDGDLNSEVTISNIRQEVIPEPTIIVLMGCGLVGLVSVVVRQRSLLSPSA